MGTPKPLDLTAWWSLPEEVLAGPWAERRRLASALRALTDLCLTSTGSAELLAQAADAAEDARRILESAPTQSTSAAWREGAWFRDPGRFADRNLLVGHCHPFAPPMVVHWDGEQATGEVTLRAAQGGAPGIAHGGVVASLFDQVFGHAVVYSDLSGLTSNLTISYLKPTPLDTQLFLTGIVTTTHGKTTQLAGRLHRADDESLLAEGSATFIRIDASHMRAMTKET